MATRAAYPGTEAAADVLTATNFHKLPGGNIAYAQNTSAQTLIASGTLVVNVTVTLLASRRYRIEGKCRIQQNTSNQVGGLQIRDGTSTVLDESSGNLTGGESDTPYVVTWVAPGAGAKTYGLYVVTTGATVTTIVDSTRPAFISVDDVGPSF